MSQNKNPNFFKFQNVQIVRKSSATQQTRQNTQINTAQGTAEEQFAAIEAAARTEAQNSIADFLSEDKSVDYNTPPPQTLNTQVKVHQAKPQLSDTDDTTSSLPIVLLTA